MTYGSKNSSGRSSGGRDLTPEPTHQESKMPTNIPRPINEGAVTTSSASRTSKNEVGQYKK